MTALCRSRPEVLLIILGVIVVYWLRRSNFGYWHAQDARTRSSVLTIVDSGYDNGYGDDKSDVLDKSGLLVQ